MSRRIILAAMLSMGLFVSACNTMSGAGEDISAGGKAIDRSAEKNKGY